MPQSYIPENIARALLTLSARMSAARIVTRSAGLPCWAITGSLGLALQGVPVAAVHDIDLQTDKAGAAILQELLAEYCTQPVYFRASERIRSHFATLAIDGVKVEIMGDVEKRGPGGAWGAAPDLPALIRWTSWNHFRLPVLDLRYEQRAYEEMGRADKAELIARFLLDQAGTGDHA